MRRGLRKAALARSLPASPALVFQRGCEKSAGAGWHYKFVNEGDLWEMAGGENIDEKRI